MEEDACWVANSQGKAYGIKDHSMELHKETLNKSLYQNLIQTVNKIGTNNGTGRSCKGLL